jgi:hypothetical protein
MDGVEQELERCVRLGAKSDPRTERQNAATADGRVRRSDTVG